MDASRPVHPTGRHQPASVPLTGTVEHFVRKLSIALVEMPERICGQAFRVGYAGRLSTDLAIYRLKVKSRPELHAVTLSGLFVLEHGLFHEYER
jgi:hypothetical protein